MCWHEFSARSSKNNSCLKTNLQLIVKWIKLFFNVVTNSQIRESALFPWINKNSGTIPFWWHYYWVSFDLFSGNCLQLELFHRQLFSFNLSLFLIGQPCKYLEIIQLHASSLFWNSWYNDPIQRSMLSWIGAQSVLIPVLFDPLEREAVRGQGGDGGGDGVRRRDDLRPLVRQALPHLLHHHLRGSAGLS